MKNESLAPEAFYPIKNANPITSNYVGTQNFDWNTNDTIYVIGYQNKFPAADMPFEDMKPLAPTLVEDTIFIQSDSTKLEQYRLYYYQLDTLSDEGIGLFQVPPYFPSFEENS